MDFHTLVQNAPLYSKGSSYSFSEEERPRSSHRQTGRLGGEEGGKITLLKRWRWRQCCYKTASVSSWDPMGIVLNSPWAVSSWAPRNRCALSAGNS